jgi:hypothetical protein
MQHFFSTFRNENNNSVETVIIQPLQNENSTESIFVLIKEDKTYKPILNLKITTGNSSPFKDTQIFNDVVLIGSGDSFVTFNLNTRKQTIISLDGYFGNFRIHDDKVFVCSASDVTCLSLGGEIKWKSESIAIDGVIINSFENSIIYCSREWDPPGGWQPCQLDFLSGTTLKNIT